MNFNRTIITNNEFKTVKDYFPETDLERILIASAFFSSHTIIEKWLRENIKIQLLVSLRPPTDYYSLKKILTDKNIEVKFLGKLFHSKFFIFFMGENPIRSIIGSSNFTGGGLVDNIETNVVFDDIEFSKNLLGHFKVLWEKANCLEPSDLDKYKIVFDDFKNRSNSTLADDFESEINKERNGEKVKSDEVIKEARQYTVFWRIVDEIKDIVSDVSEKEYPGIPVYLVIDHFWHWVKIIWGKENPNFSVPDSGRIKAMFGDYCMWDKDEKNFTKEVQKRSEEIFQKYLSPQRISQLSKEEAKLVYESLHSGGSRSNRFSSDESFINQNTIEKIRRSLKYLLYSNDDIEQKIHRMAKDDQYKLEELGLSGIQELIGWVHSKKYPIRNNKADTAVKMLGYKI